MLVFFRLIHLSRNHLSEFKKITNIPTEQSITKNIFGRFGNKIPDDILDLELNDTLTVKEYYETCLLHCKTKILNLPYLNDETLRSYKGTKSISMIAETLKILRTNLGYDEELVSAIIRLIL